LSFITDFIPRSFLRQWTALLAAWIGVGVLIVALLCEERSDIETSEKALLSHQAHIIHDNLSRQLDAIDRALRTLAQEVPIAPFYAQEDSRLNSRLRAFSDAMTGVRTLAVLDKHGTAISANRPELIGQNFQHRDYFQTAVRGSQLPQDALMVSAPFQTLSGFWSITLARVVHTENGQLAALMVATLDPEDFRILLNSVRYAPDVVSSLSHADGLRFLTAPENLEQHSISAEQTSTLLKRHIVSDQQETITKGVLDSGTSQRLVVMQTFQPPQLKMDKALVATVSRDWSAIFAPWLAKAALVGFLWFAAGIAAGATLGFSQHRRRELMRREQALEQETAALQARWHAVLMATQQGVWDCDIKAGTIYLSPVWKEMLGYGPLDLGNTMGDWEALVHPDDLPQMQAVLQQHFQGQSALYESVHRVRCKGGEFKWVLDRGQIIERDAEGKPIRLIGTQTDVSTQRQQQETLNRLADHVPGALYQYLLRADGHAHFPYISRGIEDLYGKPPQALCDDAALIFNTIHPDDLPHVYESIQASAQSLQLWREEYRVVLQQGVRWISGQAMPQRTADGDVLWHGYIQDITQAKEQSLQLQNTERLLQHLLQEMPVGLCMVNGAGEMYFRNRRFLEIFGYTQEEVPTLDEWWQRAYPDPTYRDKVMQTWNAALRHARARQGEIENQEYYVTDSDGRNRTMAISGVTFGDDFLAMFVDRTEQQMQKEMFRKLAFFDSLTELPNRRQFDHSLKAEWRRSRRSGKPLALIMFDIDHFKQYNDLYGHQKGDECLRTVAQALRDALVRPHDLVARYGGEEFVCLLPECDLDGAMTKAQKLCQAVQEKAIPHADSSTGHFVTVSAGVACLIPNALLEPSSLIQRADENLYRAKALGRNVAIG
jgi:diguanylate cyclase (GGDEF)-like protein/PAS domain S-box-containing protein